MSNVYVDKTKIDILANAIAAKSGESVTMTLDEMVSAVDGIQTGGGTPTLETVTKTYTPSTSAVTDTITPSAGYDGIEEVDVTVSAIPISSAVDDGCSIEFVTSGGIRKARFTPWIEYNDDGYVAVTQGVTNFPTNIYNAVASGTTVTPTESSQTIGGTRYMMEGAVTVNAISSTYVGSGVAQRDSSNLSASGATVTAPSGYYASAATKTISSGTATPAASISGTSATVSTGTNTLTLSKTVSNTPQVSAGYVSSGTAGNSSVSLTASVTTKAATTYHPSASQQTIASGTYLTGTQTINAVTTTNLTAANIKNGVTVTVGDSSDPDSVTSVTGTYEGGGSSGMQIATKTTTLEAAAASISFSGLSGEPTSFAITTASDLATGASPWKTAAVTFDGTNLNGQIVTNTSNAQASHSTSFTKSYSNGTLTVTGTGTNFQANQYKLVYTYGGNSANLGTDDVQVGSGATSISFTGLSAEPDYFSIVFTSDFSTSSGYQRVMAVVYDGNSTYGVAMDSGAKALSSWSYTYSNGTLTVSSTGTNNGGYFHQPGDYHLTYGIGGDQTLQTKTVTPTTSTQNITADTAQGYTALRKVVVNPIPSSYVQPTSTIGATTYRASTTSQTIASGTYHSAAATIAAVTQTNLSADNIKSGTTISISNGQSNLWSVTGTYSGGGGGTLTVATKTASLSAVGQTLSFTGLSGTPKYWFVKTTSQISSSGSTTIYYITDGFWDGTSVKGNSFRIGSTRRIYSWTSGVSQSYSGGTLTITGGSGTGSSPGQFFNGSYELTYVY